MCAKTEVPENVVGLTPLSGGRTEVETGSGAKLVLDLSADKVEQELRDRGLHVKMSGDC